MQIVGALDVHRRQITHKTLRVLPSARLTGRSWLRRVVCEAVCTAVTRPLARVNKQGPHAFVCPRGVAGCWLSWKSRTAAALPLVERIQFAFSLASIGANRGYC